MSRTARAVEYDVIEAIREDELSSIIAECRERSDTENVQKEVE